MNAIEFLNSPLIEIRCIRTKPNGRRCMRWLGDMIAGQHVIQNFKCPDCGVEWLVEKDCTDSVTFIRVPRDFKKDYRQDTGFRIEIGAVHDRSSGT